MSQHNIVGSEAFNTEPVLYVRVLKSRRTSWGGVAATLLAGGGLVVAAAFAAAYFGQAFGV